MGRNVIEYIDGAYAIKQSSAGLLVLVEGEEVWIPLSEIQPDSQVSEVGDEGVLAIPHWLAADRGLL